MQVFQISNVQIYFNNKRCAKSLEATFACFTSLRELSILNHFDKLIPLTPPLQEGVKERIKKFNQFIA